MNLNIRQFMTQHWHLIILLAIILTSFSFRAMPARFNELQALDPFLFYRMSDYTLNNNWQLPESDMLRYYPTGVDSHEYVTLLPVYMPALIYSGLTAVGYSEPYLNFAIIFPAIMGTLAVLVMYFIGKDLFNSRLAGLFAAFFLATTPAFLTRTSAGFFEKEPIAGLMMLLTVFFFIRAFKKDSWVHGSFAGIFLGILGLTWGGVQYFYLLTAGFVGILFGVNAILVVLDYLFPGNFNNALEKLEEFMGMRMIKAFLPLIAISVFIQLLLPISLSFNNALITICAGILGIMLVRFGLKKYNLMKEDSVKYFVPGVLVFAIVVILIGSMFSGFLAGILNQIVGYANPSDTPGALGTTIAENMPGSWDEVTGKLSNSMAGQALPQLGALAPYFTLWVFAVLGSVLLAYKSIKTKNYMYVFVLFWFVSSIWSVFAKIRLTFLVGPAAAIAGAFFFMWLINKMKKTEIMRNSTTFTSKINLVSVPVIIIVSLALLFNFANGYAYSSVLGPSICFPIADENGNIRPCLEINEDGTYSMDSNQPWYQAMEFLEGTGQDNSVLSWWDFGYWFQARGNKPSVADGGNLGDNPEEGLKYGGRNKEIAQWFTSPTSSWSEHVGWLKQYEVGYILMDYTLIGKFGAITSIASGGQNILGFMEFQQSNTYQRDGQTVFEFSNGPYAIWMPADENGNAESSLKFMVKQDGKYYQQGYINDVCTASGVMHIGDEEPSIGGCVAMSSLGVYYVPPEAKDTIFANLMFMDGHGLPLEKVFDNVYVKIYKVLY